MAKRKRRREDWQGGDGCLGEMFGCLADAVAAITCLVAALIWIF